jgi:Flp pilus assembly pilin Flp
MSRCRLLWSEDSGQDVVEYGLLMAFFALCAVAVWPSIRDALAIGFGGTGAGLQGLWDPPPPSAPAGS